MHYDQKYNILLDWSLLYHYLSQAMSFCLKQSLFETTMKQCLSEATMLKCLKLNHEFNKINKIACTKVELDENTML